MKENLYIKNTKIIVIITVANRYSISKHLSTMGGTKSTQHQQGENINNIDISTAATESREDLNVIKNMLIIIGIANIFKLIYCLYKIWFHKIKQQYRQNNV